MVRRTARGLHGHDVPATGRGCGTMLRENAVVAVAALAEIGLYDVLVRRYESRLRYPRASSTSEGPFALFPSPEQHRLKRWGRHVGNHPGTASIRKHIHTAVQSCFSRGLLLSPLLGQFQSIPQRARGPSACRSSQALPCDGWTLQAGLDLFLTRL
jgi:hypothetical protein